MRAGDTPAQKKGTRWRIAGRQGCPHGSDAGNYGAGPQVAGRANAGDAGADNNHVVVFSLGGTHGVLPGLLMQHAIQRLARAGFEVCPDWIRDRDQRRLRHRVVGNPKYLRGFALIFQMQRGPA